MVVIRVATSASTSPTSTATTYCTRPLFLRAGLRPRTSLQLTTIKSRSPAPENRCPIPEELPLAPGLSVLPHLEVNHGDSGSRAREQQIDEVDQYGQTHARDHADQYPEQASSSRASASPAPSSEHDYEKVQHEQIRQLTILSRRSPSGQSGTSTQGMSNQTTAAAESIRGRDTRHPHGMTMQPPRVLPRLQRNTGTSSLSGCGHSHFRPRP